MARNGSGNYSKVNTFVPNTTITASDHNQNWDDIATEMTNSVAADGQTSMTGPLKASNGTASAPAVTFASDTNTGIYRVGADDIGIAVGGTKIVDVASTGVAVTGGVTVSGDVSAATVKQGGFSLQPIGAIIAFGGSSAPSGWLLCDGSNVSRTTYASLFAVLSTSYGSGDGSTTFGIPDLKGRVIAGKEASATRLTSTYFGGNSTNLGATGGLESNNVILTHTHTVNETSHSHPGVQPAGGATAKNGSGSTDVYAATSGSTGSAVTGITINNAGSASAHNIVQPTIICNYIIFAGA